MQMTIPKRYDTFFSASSLKNNTKSYFEKVYKGLNEFCS